MGTARSEIRAFQEGETAISLHFDGRDRAHEEHRRAKTPLLLAADPNEFVISIVPGEGGEGPLIADGHHRLAIAEAAGLNHVKVVAILPRLKCDLNSSNRSLWHWLLLPFSSTQARQ